ncbi:nuclear transport factor 2 family protein [Flagellimonas meishanensis]|uniref:nuclear transport factor 2 family protein n=1 Tax=Flagellimonas meishanensis TaxID=2873264 RepID=UPI001CA6A610|nr:nuclear transport factor 2 family protein [[Muricauda] meishanensis]
MKTRNRTNNWILILFMALQIPTGVYSQNKSIESEILKNGEIIRKAFADGNIEKIKSLHHPDVIKALGYNDLKIGRDEVIRGLKETLENFNLEFIKNDVESIFVNENIAIEQTKFSIRGIPKNGGEPFIFSGRTMVTYIRYDKSPTGWATIREIIQPATE